MKDKKQHKRRVSPPKRKPINSKLSEDVIKRWSVFAANNMMTKEEALETLIVRGSKA
jgi:hypothetical protein